MRTKHSQKDMLERVSFPFGKIFETNPPPQKKNAYEFLKFPLILTNIWIGHLTMVWYQICALGTKTRP